MFQWRWIWRELQRRIWFRAALISLLAVVMALAGPVIAPIIPYELSVSIGGPAVDTILSILASSMLAVTTFSLTAMVAAFSGASQQITPRAVHLLIEDRTAQNALSTFIGGFVFSLVGIVALTTGFYGERGRVILFFGTIAMTVVIVITLLRWISRLVHFGRVEDAIETIEERTGTALEEWSRGLTFDEGDGRQEGAHSVFADETGFVALVDHAALCGLAEKHDLRLSLSVAPGDFVDPTVVLAFPDKPLSDKDASKLRAAFTVREERSYENDPRFGLSVLAEIALRALSPAVNDPGTAIMALHAGQRLLDDCGRVPACDPVPRVDQQPLRFLDCLDALILPLLRDAAPILEVGQRLQAMLGSLGRQLPGAASLCERRADEALDRARRSAMAPQDVERLEAAHRQAFG